MLRILVRLIEETFGLSPVFQAKCATTLVLVAALAALRAVLVARIAARTEDPKAFYRARRRLSTALSAFAAVVLLPLWFREVRAVATMLGLVAAALVIISRDLLLNLAGRVAIAWGSPFDVGDRIEIGAVKGDVLDLGLTHIALMEVGNWVGGDQSTGRTVLVPNQKVFTETIVNASRPGFLWADVPVRLTPEADVARMKEILTAIAAEVSARAVEKAREKMGRASQRYLLRFARLTPIVYTDFGDDRVILRVRFLTETLRRRDAESAFREAVLEAAAREPALRRFLAATAAPNASPSPAAPGT